MNLRAEVNIPGDFADFTACFGNSEITNHTASYSIDFGAKAFKSQDEALQVKLNYPSFDAANEQLWEDFDGKLHQKENCKSYFDMLINYQAELAKLDQAIIWKEAINGNPGHNSIYQTR